MKLHRFYIKNNLNIGVMELTERGFVNQIKNVLKLRVGEGLILFNGSELEAKAKIKEITSKKIELEIESIYKNECEPKNNVCVYLAILKKENFELATQKAVECGVMEITPVRTERTVKLNLNKERIEKIIKEATEQSGRSILPKLNNVIQLREFLPKKDELNLFLDAGGENINEINLSDFRKINLLIGPEGGWSEDEINFATRNGFTKTSLGKTTLRAETAAIVASYLATRLII